MYFLVLLPSAYSLFLFSLNSHGYSLLVMSVVRWRNRDQVPAIRHKIFSCGHIILWALSPPNKRYDVDGQPSGPLAINLFISFSWCKGERGQEKSTWSIYSTSVFLSCLISCSFSFYFCYLMSKGLTVRERWYRDLNEI